MSIPGKPPALLAATVATACALRDEQRIGGCYWTSDGAAPKREQVVWKQVSRDRIPGLCGDVRREAPGLAHP